MEVLKNVSQADWSGICKRPTIDDGTLSQTVRAIMDKVKRERDQALFFYAKEFDQVSISEVQVQQTEVEAAIQLVPQALKNAIAVASNNIRNFHRTQVESTTPIDTMPGVTCWRKNVGIEKVGLYIPGGTAPLFSTVLMLGIPAILAGCKQIVICTPCNQAGEVNPVVLYTAHSLGIQNIFKVGGAQAIAAMAYGTERIPQVNKIFGPGNQYVTKAKELVQREGIAIDMPAGPSELLIVADENAVPKYVAADLLSQSEHGIDSQVILVSNSEQVISETVAEIEAQLAFLPRTAIASAALKNSSALLFDSLEKCIDFSNAYAPEHLILATQNANDLANNITNAGSVFLGNYTCESAGDYASGTNHTLPTNGFARSYSGVSVDSFVKKITFQSITKEGLQNIGPTIEIMAEAEQLFAHKNAVTIRLNDINHA